MPIALEARGLSKAFRAGTGLCSATTQVLRHIDFALHTGEVVGLLGPRGSGKSTLLLCLAGLLRADVGSVRWFGDAARSTAVQRVLYHAARTDLMRVGAGDGPHIHLVDIPSFAGLSADLDRWIELRQHAGDAVIISARYRSAFPPEMAVYSVQHGRLRLVEPDHARVAEAIRMRA